MGKCVTVLVLLLCFASSAPAQKTRFGQAPPKPPRPADFSIKVHVSGSHLRLNCAGNDNGPAVKVSCGYGLYADSMVNGKKLELWGNSVIEKHNFMVLIPGDYQARLTGSAQSKDGAAIHQDYDLLLPDGTTWHCIVSSISE
jgi:hypothetical protein